MIKKNKILSFDLDMTLVDDVDNSIPKSAIDAINQLRNDFYIVIATGRDLNLKTNQFVLEEIKPDAWIHNNGALVNVKEKILQKKLFNKKILTDILKTAADNNICICAAVNNIQYATRPEKLKPLEHLLSKGTKIIWGDYNELPDLNVCTLGLAGNEDDAVFMRKYFPELKFTEVIPEIWYDVMENDVSKLMGMKKLTEYYGLSLKDVTAFGDSMNDYEIMSEAGFSVAMGNSSPALKEIADYITDDIDKDGIANALKKLFL